MENAEKSRKQRSRRTVLEVENSEKSRKQRNRRSKLFYISCDYLDIDPSEDNGYYLLQVPSEVEGTTEPLTIEVENTLEPSEDNKERKRRNRKSKLFYVNCDYLNVNDSSCDVHAPSDCSDEPATTEVENTRKQTQEDDKERKRRNRKSKLFYVSCDYLNINDDILNDQV